MQQVEMTLPYPPTVNSYWERSGRNTMCVSKKGKNYQWAVFLESQGKPKFGGQVELEFGVYFPDRRERDLDNLGKCLLDSLVACRMITNDSHDIVKKITFEDMGYCPNKQGYVVAKIKERTNGTN